MQTDGEDSDDAVFARERAAAVVAGLDAVGLGLATVDQDGHILAADAIVCALLGRTEDELRALPDIVACIAPEERSASIEIRSRRRGEPLGPYRRELTLLDSSDNRIPVELTVTPLQWHDGRRDFLLLVHDMRSRITRQALVERYVRLVEAMPIGVILWDTEGVDDPMDIRLISANAAANRSLRFDVDGRAGDTVLQIFSDTQRFDDAARTLAMRGVSTPSTM